MLALGFVACTRADDINCSSPHPSRLMQVVLRDAVTGQNLLDTPRRYLLIASRSPMTAAICRKWVMWIQRSSHRPFVTVFTGRLSAADTDTVTIERPAVGTFQFRYNGRLEISRSDEDYNVVILEVRK